MLPPIDPSQPTPAIGDATFASALVDTPEVRAFMEFVASPEWGEVWATDAYDGFISPNRRFDVSAYGDANLDPAAAVRIEDGVGGPDRTGIRGVQIRRLRSDAHRDRRCDRDDDGELVAGAFWQGMLDWVDGVRTIDQVFADIDAEWEALRAEG